MVIVLLMGGGFYFYDVFSQSLRLDSWISPVISGLFKLTFMLIRISITGHIIIVAISSKEAEVK
jgi:hypothetical protein